MFGEQCAFFYFNIYCGKYYSYTFLKCEALIFVSRCELDFSQFEERMVPALFYMLIMQDKNIVEIAVEVSIWTDLNFFLWYISILQQYLFFSFYAIFHCLCNILAEFTGYLNRASFYGNWWFAIKVRTYIRCWSKPVSDWFFVHFMYKTTIKNRFYWTCISILFSCTLHEVSIIAFYFIYF